LEALEGKPVVDEPFRYLQNRSESSVPDVYSAMERAAFEEYDEQLCAHISHRLDPESGLDAEEVLEELKGPGPETPSFLRNHGLVSIPVLDLESLKTAKLLWCPLEKESELYARDAVEEFYQKHHKELPNIGDGTAQKWSKYGQNLATLVDAYSRYRQEIGGSGASFVGAPRPPTEINTEEDLKRLDDAIEQLELGAEGVMFVVSVLCFLCDQLADLPFRMRPKMIWLMMMMMMMWMMMMWMMWMMWMIMMMMMVLKLLSDHREIRDIGSILKGTCSHDRNGIGGRRRCS